MDMLSLQAFIAVAENASFSRAAEQLFKTQPALSKRIAQLEEQLGCRLFDRLGREVRTTEAGERLLVHARRILADMENSRDDVRSLAGDVAGRLKLGTSHHIGLHRLPGVLKRFVQRYPDVELDLKFMDSEQACLDVAEGRLELAVVTLPEHPDSALETELIWRDPLAIMAAPDHPLAATPGPISPADLVRWPAVLPAQGTITRSILLEALRPHDARINTALESNYLETIKMLISVGLGWSVLPESMSDDSIVTLPIAGLSMYRHLGTVRHQGRTPSRAARAFIELIRSEPREST